MKKIIIFSIFFLLTIPVFAETILLKSGKKVEGEIIGQTDKYIKIDFQGLPITYYLDDIESINGEKISVPHEENGYIEEISKKQSQINNWETWYANVEVYLDKLGALANENGRIQSEAGQKMKYLSKKDKFPVIKDLIQQLSRIEKEIDNLTPPPELDRYHQFYIKIIGQQLEMYRQTMANIDFNPEGQFKNINRLTLDALAELKRVYIEHGAPDETINQLNSLIANGEAELKQRLNKLKQKY